MSDLETLYQRNRRFAGDFDGGSLTMRPRLSTIILACMDARVDPAHVLGLEIGDAFVLRNAGARVTDEVERQLAILWALAGQMPGGRPERFQIAVVHHTECGMERLSDPDVRQRLSEESGVGDAELQALAIADHDACIIGDLERLRASKRIPDALLVSGHVYDVATGALRQVVQPMPAGLR